MARDGRRIRAPYDIPREWTSTTAEHIQLNFERLFQQLSQPIAVTIVNEAEVIAEGTPPVLYQPRAAWELWASGNAMAAVGIVIAGSGFAGHTTGPAAAAPPFADGPYTSIGNPTLNSTLTAGGTIASASCAQDLIWDFDTSLIIRTDSNAISTLRRYILGMCQSIDNADSPTQAGCFFRFSTSASDVGWVALCHDGTTLSSAVNVAPIAADSRYLLRMRKVANVCYFSVNGGAEIAVSSNVPVTTRLGCTMRVRLTNLSGTLQNLHYGRAWGIYGTTL